MKKTQIMNMSQGERIKTERNGSTYYVSKTSDEGLMVKSSVNVVEVDPLSTAYGYHYHVAVEEIFYIVSGEGIVETIDGTKEVKAGDVISFPLGEGGVHVIKNTSKTDQLVYLDFSTKAEIDIAHLPNDQKMMVMTKDSFNVFDTNKS